MGGGGGDCPEKPCLRRVVRSGGLACSSAWAILTCGSVAVGLACGSARLGLEGGGPAAREVLVHVHGRLRLAVDRALADRRRPLTAHLGPAERAAPLPARRLGNRVQLRRRLIPWARASTHGPGLVEALVEGAAKEALCATHVVDCRTGRAARRQCPSEHAAVLRAPVLQQQPLLRVLCGHLATL